MWYLLSFVFVIAFARAEDQPCHFHMSVNITDGRIHNDNTIYHNGIIYNPDEHFIYADNTTEAHRRGCICLKKPCFRKCCPEGQGMLSKACMDSDDPILHPFSPPVFDGTHEVSEVVASEHFALVFGNPCEGERYLAHPISNKEDQFYLQQNGYLHMPHALNESQMEYCIDAFLKDPFDPDDTNWNASVLALICFVEPTVDIGRNIQRSVYSIGMFTSIPFLIATFAVYAFVPELRNLHGKSLMCYISGLLVGYSVLAPLQFTSVTHDISTSVCIALAFLGYFSLLVTFFWLNIMCFDIWWTFSGLRGFSGSRRASERKRFLLYSLYGWGSPLLIIMICAFLQFYPNIPENIITPKFAVKKCWFMDWSSEMLFLYAPMMILVLCNLCLFTITACKIVEIKKETAMLQNSESGRHDQYEKDKQRFKLYLKLFIVMGVNWIAEFVSFLLGGEGYWWILTDLFNTVLGVYIFIIFVWKRKVKKLIVKRYHLIRYGRDSSKALSSSQSGHTTTSHVDGERTSSTHHDGIKLREISRRNNV